MRVINAGSSLGKAALLGLLAFSLLAAQSVIPVSSASATGTSIINNSALRFGNGSENSIGPTGLLRQPFYYNGSSWRQLTYNTYPLDLAFGYGSGNGSQWNGNTVYELSEGVTNPTSAVTVDYSGLTLTGGGITGGWGTVTTSADFSLGGKAVKFEHKYTLGQNDDYIRIETKVTNNSGGSLPASSIWVGTRDDYVGGDDGPTKTRGNIDSSGFTAINNQTAASNAIEIKSQNEGVLFYSVSTNAASIVDDCCSFSNVTGKSPATSGTVTGPADGSYAMYFPLGDLANGETKTVVWFYAAGSIQDLTSVVQQVAAAGAAEQTLSNLTTAGGTLDYTFNLSGTAYYMVVDRAATAPTAAQIVAGGNYGAVTVRTSGNSVLSGSGSSWTKSFSISGLEAATSYTVYTTTRYTDNGNTVNSEVKSVNFSTLAAAPTLGTATAGNGQASIEFTPSANITNIQYSTNGGTSWSTRSPASTASPLVITGLTNGTSYDIQIRGVFDSQGGVATASTTVTPFAAPGVPRNLSIAFGAGSGSTVSWQAPTSNGGFAITSYTAEYNKGSGWLPATVSGTTATLADVWVDSSWSFRVAAVSSKGTGSFATIENNPVPTAVTAPTGPSTLVTPTNQQSITATPGQSVVGTVNNGVVTPVNATVTRITATAVADIQTQADNIINTFDSLWDGQGANTPPVLAVDTPEGALIFGLVADSVSSDPIGIPAQDVILITTNDQAVLLAGANGNVPAKVNSSGALVINDGALLGFAVNGFDPNAQGELVLLSTPTLLGTFTTDANGSFTGQAAVPNGFTAGNHTATLITSGLVTSMGLVVEAASRGPVAYNGPAVGKFSIREIPANQLATVTVEGQKLSTVSQVLVDGKNVPFTLGSKGQLVLSLPRLTAGVYDLVMISEFGRVTHQAAFTVRPTSSTGSARLNVGSFNGKIVIYAANALGKKVTWKVGGRWGSGIATSNYAIFNRLTPKAGATVSVEIYVNAVKILTKSVITR